MPRQKAIRKRVLVGQDEEGNDIYENQTEIVDFSPGEEAAADVRAQFERRQRAIATAFQSIDEKVTVRLNELAAGWGDTRRDLQRFESMVRLIGTPVTAKQSVISALAIFDYAKAKRVELSNPATPVETVEAYDAFNDGSFP